MIESVEFMSVREAVSKLPKPGEVMISIVDPSHDPRFELPAWPKTLIRYFRFDDLVLDLFPEERSPYVLFDETMAREIIAFTDALHLLPQPIRLIVHCMQGVSRSAAVAYWAHRNYGTKLPANFGIRACPNVRVFEILSTMVRAD